MLFSLKNTFFTVFSCIIQNPIVSVWYYRLPFFSNVETQVNYYVLMDISVLHRMVIVATHEEETLSFLDSNSVRACVSPPRR